METVAIWDDDVIGWWKLAAGGVRQIAYKNEFAAASSIIRNLVWKFQLIENLFQWIHNELCACYAAHLGPTQSQIVDAFASFFSSNSV